MFGLFGGLTVRELENVLGFNLAGIGFDFVHAYDVEAEARIDYRRDTTQRGVIGRLFEGPGEAAGQYPAHASAASGTGTIYGCSGCVLKGGGAGQDGIAYRVGVGHSSLRRGGAIGGRQHDMADIAQLACMVVSFVQQRVVDGGVHHTRLSQLGGISLEFVAERGRGIHAGSYGGSHFQLVVDKHVHIFVKCLRLQLL